MGIELKASEYSSNIKMLATDLDSALRTAERTSDADYLHNKLNEIELEEKIGLSFVGQYDAGKSTIIRALTGQHDILIDTDISTAQVSAYDWGSIILYDTPGIKTGEHEEHDQMTKDAISRSDLLVYCITSDLFSYATAKDFKELATAYRSKIFLVVNKMSKESGVYEDLIENYKDSINKTLAPEYSIQDFHHFFIDAKDYWEGLQDNDDDFIEDSHFESFINKLNDFISVKGLLGKMLTPVNLMIDVTENALIELETDEHTKEARKLITKIYNIIEDKKNSFEKTCNLEIQSAFNKMIRKGDDIALHLGDKNFEFTDKSFQNFSEPLQENLCKCFTDTFEKYALEVDAEVQQVMQSEMAQHFFHEHEQRLKKKVKGQHGTNDAFNTLKTELNKVSLAATPKITEWLAKFANVKDGKKITIWTVKGSDLHSTVKKVGTKLGYKFKPYEALKISKKIADLSRYIGPILTGAGTILEVVMQISEFVGEKKLAKAKDDVKSVFKAMAEETEAFYKNQLKEACSEFDDLQSELQNSLRELDTQADISNASKIKLIEIKNKLIKLKQQIDNN